MEIKANTTLNLAGANTYPSVKIADVQGSDSATATLQAEGHRDVYRCFLILSQPKHFSCPPSNAFLLPLLFATFQLLSLPFPSHSGLSFPKFSFLLPCPFSSVTSCPKILQFPTSASGELRSGTSILTLSSISVPILPIHCTCLYSQLCLISLSSLIPTLLRHRVHSFPLIPTVLKAGVPQKRKQLCQQTL